MESTPFARAGRHAGPIGMATELARRGRHAAALRALRRAHEALRRRHEMAGAALVGLAVARLHLSRGHVEEANTAAKSSRRLFHAASDAPGVMASLICEGWGLVDLGQLVDAESVLRDALHEAERLQETRLIRASAGCLARCLLWSRRHDEARAMTERAFELDHRPPSPDGEVAERCPGSPVAVSAAERGVRSQAILPWGVDTLAIEVAVRLALADQRVPSAAALLRQARDTLVADPFDACTLHACASLVQGTLGHVEEARAECLAGLKQARRVHATIAALELRLAHAEALMHAGARQQATASLLRLSRWRRTPIPGLIRRRVDGLEDALRQPPIRQPVHSSPDTTHREATALMHLLQLCSDAPGDRRLAAGVCRVLREALGPVAVSVFCRTASGIVTVAHEGGTVCSPEAAGRWLRVANGSRPLLDPDGRITAVPVVWGTTAVGVLAVRCPDTLPDAGRWRPGLLSAVAAALAPTVAALADSMSSTTGCPDAVAAIGGLSDAVATLRRDVLRAAAAPFPVLVQGESGTGKELIARAIHLAGPRRGRRLCAVNCAAIADDLFEAELFGHTRGAFTGAANERVGLMEEADGGTLFLDEVGELSPRAQAKLLRALQEGEVRRIGENTSRRVDVRIVAASNRALKDEVHGGRFRNDLLFRLDVIRIEVPPLRERREDIPVLAMRFWRDAVRRAGGQAELAPATVAALARYDWPGNVRELQNVLAALAVRAPRCGRVGPVHLPVALVGEPVDGGDLFETLERARRRFEHGFVRAALVRSGGRRTHAASELGVTRQGLAKLIARLGIDAAPNDEAPGVAGL